MRHRAAAMGLGAAALTLAALTVAPLGVTPLPPPVEVERVEPTQPGLVIAPAVTAAEPDEDGAVVVEHRIVNGTSDELRLEVEVQAVDRATGRPDPDAELEVEVEVTARELQLAPSEAARVASVARAVEVGAAYAVVAEVVGADPPATITSIVLAPAGPADVAVGEVALTPHRLVVPLEVQGGPGLVDAAVRLRAWFGHTVLEAGHPELIVWDDQDHIELTYDLEDVHAPGPYRVEVVASGGAGEVRADVTRWLLPAAAVYTSAVVLLAVAGLTLGMTWRRRRRRSDGV